MAYNENPHAVNLYDRESEVIEEELRMQRRSWLRSHMTVIYIVAGILIAVAVFFIIKGYRDSNNPVNRFISASGKDLGTSFGFRMTAQMNGEAMMSYEGAMKVDTSAETVTVAYDAVYPDYSYTNVLYTDGSKAYHGNRYQNQWVVTDCTAQVHEFFDFYHDYQNGSFDGGSFLRFTNLNRYLYADEFNKFMSTLKSRLTADSAVARITSTEADGVTEWHYEINLKELLDLIRTQGAPMFYASTLYDSFVARTNANIGRVEKARCSFDYTIDAAGWLSRFELTIGSAENTYTISAEMNRFGSAEPAIPDEFYQAAGLNP